MTFWISIYLLVGGICVSVRSAAIAAKTNQLSTWKEDIYLFLVWPAIPVVAAFASVGYFIGQRWYKP